MRGVVGSLGVWGGVWGVGSFWGVDGCLLVRAVRSGRLVCEE